MHFSATAALPVTVCRVCPEHVQTVACVESACD
jgi:hypothetical protein